MILNRFKF